MPKVKICQSFYCSTLKLHQYKLTNIIELYSLIHIIKINKSGVKWVKKKSFQ